MEEFAIALGAKLDIDNLREQIKRASSNLQPIEITIDTKKAQGKLTSLTEQVSRLNNEFKIADSMSTWSANLGIINNSLKSIAKIIDSINKADGFNNLANGLNNLSPVAETLRTELASIKSAMEAFKGVNINVGITSGSSKTAYDTARSIAISELRQQVSALENIYMQYTKTTQGFVGVMTALRGTNIATQNNLFGVQGAANDPTLKIDEQINALQKYLNILHEGAALKGIDLSPATSTFARTANEIVNSVHKIGTGQQTLENQTKQLQGLFGSGINAELLTQQLNEIKIAIDGVTSAIANIKFDGSTLEAFKDVLTSLNVEINRLGASINGVSIQPRTSDGGNITNITQQANNANIALQQLNRTNQQMQSIGQPIISQTTRDNFEQAISGIISDENQLQAITRQHFQQFGDVTTNTFRNIVGQITRFIVTVKNARNEIEALTYTYSKESDILTGAVKFNGYRYSGSSGSDNYARQLEADRKQTEKNTAAVINYTAKLQQLKTEYLNVNASKPIQNEENIAHLNALYDEAIGKVNELGTATKDNFVSTEATVKSAISELRSQITIYREVESMANQLRAKPIETIKEEQIQLLREFEAKIKSSGIAIEKLQQYNISALTTKLNEVTDRQSLTEYLNMFVVAKAEFKALQAEQQIEKKAEKQGIDQVNTAYRETLDLIHQIQAIQTTLLQLDETKDRNQILELEAQLKRLQETYTATRQSFNSRFSTEQTTDINNALQTTVDKMSTVQAKIDDVKRNLKLNIKSNIDSGTLENQIATIENNYRRLGLTEDEIKSKTIALRHLLSSMETSDDIEAVISDYNKFSQTVVTVQNDVKSLRREQQSLKEESSLANKKTALSSSIDVWLQRNSAATAQFGARLQQIKNEIASADGIKLNNLQKEFQEIRRQAELAGKATKKFGDQLRSKLGSLATYFSASMMISYAIRGIRSMFQNVLQVDTAMTELYRVTDLTEKQYSQLYDKMVAGAKKYNATLSDVISATAEWVRFGFGSNLAEQLSELTVMYQHVADLDHKLATENLLTAYKGFQSSLDIQFNGDTAAAIEHIVDVYDKLNNELPVSAAQVAEGVNKTASVLQEAGATFEQASALIVGGGSVTQDFDSMGNAIKIATLRIRGMKGKLEELGEEVDENISSVSKIQTQILNLTHGKVNIFEADGEHFRNVYDVFEDLASIWDSLSDTESAELLELIAGKNRSNSIQALLTNWSDVEQSIEAANNATGTAREEQERYSQSLQGHLDSLNASWQALSNTFLSSDFLKVLVDILTGVVDTIDGITNAFGVLGTTIATVGIVTFIKNLD